VAVLGDYAYPQGLPDCGAAPSPAPYVIKTLRPATASPAVPIVTSDGQGRLWLIAGTDSGYEGLTRIYWTNLSFTLTPAS
jgi:hypothetical protein